MLIAAARHRVAALRQPAPAARMARALWIAWAVILWNVVFDHVIVVAGRGYIAAAARAAHDAARSSPVNMDDWMRPAVTHGLWIATAAAAAVLAIGLASVSRALHRSQPSSPSNR
jgi:CTP:molybdopterin cytidylyltransferase MocA